MKFWLFHEIFIKSRSKFKFRFSKFSTLFFHFTKSYTGTLEQVNFNVHPQHNSLRNYLQLTRSDPLAAGFIRQKGGTPKLEFPYEALRDRYEGKVFFHKRNRDNILLDPTVRSKFLVRFRNLVLFEVFGVKFSAKKSIFQNCPIKRARRASLIFERTVRIFRFIINYLEFTEKSWKRCPVTSICIAISMIKRCRRSSIIRRIGVGFRGRVMSRRV